MTLDFTLSRYLELCRAIIQSGYTATTVFDYLTQNLDRCIILRHDVDRKVDRALAMAQLESRLNLQSTYYFRTTSGVFKPEIIRQISDLGHEIGYHYEALDNAKGDVDIAIDIFSHELDRFREIVDVKTACMHGNPLKRWSNMDIWEKYNFEDFGIIGEPYLTIDYSKVMYLTDTGRAWNSQSRVKDVVKQSQSRSIKSTNDIIKLISGGDIKQMCILAHPNRWTDNRGGWVWELMWQNIKNVGKKGINLMRQ